MYGNYYIILGMLVTGKTYPWWFAHFLWWLESGEDIYYPSPPYSRFQCYKDTTEYTHEIGTIY
ncbi:hypothetical protein OUZ56_025537 [Daphnia magna]|uniref:Uncharacterized protein n=1 Tax=Daphnia magna TaxID=35525 RepID=A0ABQ9ZK52_9CRUS|nr:hypothetical protein OUZ56_025537 [Daphnia magna]